MWVEILLFILLGICAVCDGIRKEIPLVVVWIGIITAFILRVQGAMGEEAWMSGLLSVLPGTAFWLLSYITGERVGYGDGWVLIMIGLFTGLRNCFLILLAGLVTESIAALILLVIGRATKDREIPFAPFLLLGMGVVLCF
ncbi:MAG: hypothetical protein K2O65_16275 [Lachnospiraceae bacterium]|nr:hypothetical protein [Lachnospiraceae bacterium]